MQVKRCEYIIKNNMPKTNGKKINDTDFLNVGYMIGRYGINLDGNLQGNYPPKITDDGIIANVNSCTSELFESNLNKLGINFDRIA